MMDRAACLPPITLRSLVTPGLEAVRRFWKPFLLLQSLALLLVIAYFYNDAVRTACGGLAELKRNTGLLYSAVAAALAGVVLPEGAKAVVLGQRSFDRQRRRDIGFALVGFALNGIIVDMQYRGLALLLGHDNAPWTVISKVLADQFITTPLYGTPYWILLYGLRAHRYRPGPLLAELSVRWYLTRVLPLLIPCWCYWIPMTLMIYSLPGELQLSLFSLALAAWSLVMIFIASRPSTPAPPAPAPESEPVTAAP